MNRSSIRTLLAVGLVVGLGLATACNETLGQQEPTSADTGAVATEPVDDKANSADISVREPPPPSDGPKPGPRKGRPDPANSYGVPVDDAPMRGNPEALITIIEYSDYQCPNCRKVLPALAKIEKVYGNKVRFVFRHQPMPMHKEAKPSAKAALAAHQQGKFWEMHDALFALAENDGLNDAAYVEIAEQLGLDVDQFNADRDGPEVAQRIADDQRVAMQFGAGGAPAFYINGRPLSGDRPFEMFKAVIDEELRKAKAYKRAHKVAPADLYAEMAKDWKTEVEPFRVADDVRRKISTAGLVARGNLEDPAITLIACSDFDVPFAARGAELVDQIFATDKYRGKVAVYFAHDPLASNEAEHAHRAAIAAGNQGRFWGMHDLLFADRSKRDERAYMEMATQLDLDVDRFLRDWYADASKQKVADDAALCAKHGAEGSPTFFLNGRMIRGSMPFTMVEPVLDEELAGGFEATRAAEGKLAEQEPAKHSAG